MAATCQIDTTLTSWKSAISSSLKSVKFVRHLTKIAIASILFHRSEIDQNAFVKHSIKDLTYIAIKSNTEARAAVDMYYSAKGVSDAIKNKYLKAMYLFLKDKDTNEIREYYKFTYSYQEEMSRDSMPKSEDLMTTTKEFLNNIDQLRFYKKLSNVEPSIEVIFCNADTPTEYCPPYFNIISEEEALTKQLPDFDSMLPLKLGTVRTGFHNIKCGAVGIAFLQSVTGSSKSVTSNASYTNSNDLIISEANSELPPSEQNIDKENLVLSISDTSEVLGDSDKYSCLCGFQYNIDKIDKIECIVCAQFQHTPCIGFETAAVIPGPYVCVCCSTPSQPASDKIMMSTTFSREKWYKIALLRFCMLYYKIFNEVPTKMLRNRLSYEKFYETKAFLKAIHFLDDSGNVNYKVLENLMIDFFNKVTLPDSMCLDDTDEMEVAEDDSEIVDIL